MCNECKKAIEIAEEQAGDARATAQDYKNAWLRERKAHSVTLRALKVVRGEVIDAHRRLKDWETGAKGY